MKDQNENITAILNTFDFFVEILNRFNFKIKEDDGFKSTAYLACGAFRGNRIAFENWLIDNKSLLGTLNPDELLSRNKEHWIVRKNLLGISLKRNGINVEDPDPPKKLKPVYDGACVVDWEEVQN